MEGANILLQIEGRIIAMILECKMVWWPVGERRKMRQTLGREDKVKHRPHTSVTKYLGKHSSIPKTYMYNWLVSYTR